jgi:hypothetical protein
LKRERKAIIEWLRKKHKDDKLSLALADKLESCKPHARCKSAACAECAYAAQRLVIRCILRTSASPPRTNFDRNWIW